VIGDDLTPDTLRDLCAQLGASQRAAAKLVGIHERTFRRMCRGTLPVTPEIVAKLRERVAARAADQVSAGASMLGNPELTRTP
jgi:hypothetical protein